MNTMQAVVLNAFDTPLSDQRIARPVPAAGQVLVRVIASGVNPLDTKIAAGKADHAQIQLPAVLGIDIAGVVDSVGADVQGFAAGDRVFGMTGGIGKVQGSLAQYAAVDARLLAHMPPQLTMREAAALPLIFITAWEGLVDRARVGEGMTVLVHGGAGGVGHMAVQLAAARGAQVYATGSADQREAIEKMGATFIDYRSTSVEQYVQQYTDGEGFDVVYDTVGGATLDASFRAARQYGGHVVSCLGWGTHALAPLSFRAATYSGVFTLLPLLSGKGRANHGAIMKEAGSLVAAGKLKVALDAGVYTLDAASVTAAHTALAEGTARGKVVVQVADI
ncbi:MULTISPECIES: zinc-dependent alcohol dehydrogenase family protein [unclassified Duganella]|uniref:zinc-dependent alcohol dehydrogenase family protein n=1 Tax=unclassified Duganella TaxID=2636909 RepID=UPI000E347D95|nr:MULTISPECIES: zinc-dependent alcohol dehydrogenase family protein [unclassified Duganella]RFP16229.1 quinone oxidoreductase [Duganella sp. BJB475]RFP32609.1 quinone oxidoreductase [Duganella sp. BJB476]